MKFKPEDFPNHEWVAQGDFRHKAFKCNKCLTYIRDDPAEKYGIFVFQYEGREKIIEYMNEYMNSFIYQSYNKNSTLIEFKKLTCSEVIIKNIIE